MSFPLLIGIFFFFISTGCEVGIKGRRTADNPSLAFLQVFPAPGESHFFFIFYLFYMQDIGVYNKMTVIF